MLSYFSSLRENFYAAKKAYDEALRNLELASVEYKQAIDSISKIIKEDSELLNKKSVEVALTTRNVHTALVEILDKEPEPPKEEIKTIQSKYESKYIISGEEKEHYLKVIKPKLKDLSVKEREKLGITRHDVRNWISKGFIPTKEKYLKLVKINE